jgi:hypothetical protein
VPLCIREAYPDRTLTFRHRGGTQVVQDIEILSGDAVLGGISVKHHGGSGTFDYINTTKVSEWLPPSDTVVESLKQIRTECLGNPTALSVARTRVKQVIAPLWDALNDARIRGVLQTIHARSPEWLCIQTPSQLAIVPHARNLEIAKFPHDPDTTYEIRGHAQSSRQIWRRTAGVWANTNLRLRLTLNNGVGALIGLSEKNKNSVLTLKIQQDAVKKLLDAIA